MPKRRYVPQRPDNKSVQDRVRRALARGLTVRSACAEAGISHTTHYLWIQRAERGEAEFVDYADAVRAGLASSESKAVAAVVAAFGTDWRAAAWYLERVHGRTIANSNDLPLTSGSENPEDVPATRAELINKLAEKLPVDVLREALAKADAPKGKGGS